ncbi:FAD binding domain protein [Aspergillus homomorphus CBS 101889]|uniref:FAD binding domain protein n=1 Tax=Aspergillus homomorphus (strain CBS 101889) TaxID=1450537 RepID=A0A395IHD0_ASPHC|nr:FAD binding domain protein [Aspergillus homomorphus CBS 101889]RAL17614.1 FAD binding domain protein [Aspergillus homomorphus CBS 101889]
MIGQLSSFLASLLPLAAASVNSSCRCFPGDTCWPSTQEWNRFNATVGGKLVATVPAASVCHHNSTFLPYNAKACEELLAVWDQTATHDETSYSPMAPWFANFSCDPYLPNTHCTIIPLVQYAVNASSAQDYQATINFAQAHNIRMVIRNTGHDYLGKSTGAGALGLWTHYLKDIEVIHFYRSKDYSGPAIKVGAGVQVLEALDAAHAQGYAAVGGNCQSVGFAGGYSQGGGHGQLVSMHGLAADQVLEWEVITATGEHLIATPTNNSDLYWAMSGGGGGTYAVALSMTSKLYTEYPTVSANLTFTNTGVTQDVFWQVAETYIQSMARLTDLGGVAIWEITDALFAVMPSTLPNGTEAQLQALMQPTLDLLERNNMTYTYTIVSYASFYDSYTQMSPFMTVTEYQIGGRLIPRTTVDNELCALIDAFRSITGYGAVVSGISLNVSRSGIPDNAVSPAWRDAQLDIVLGTAFDYYNYTNDVENQKLMTDTLIPMLEILTPDSGAYMNEADLNQPNWQWTFYRDNYAKLNSIKNKYDPNQTFYALKAVGSEVWTEQTDGRLCRT